MKATTSSLKDLYLNRLQLLLDDEKKHFKIFEKFAVLANTDELQTALAGDAAETKQHVERLKECLAVDKRKMAGKNAQIEIQTIIPPAEVLKKIRRFAQGRDISILHYIKELTMLKIAAYESLHIMVTLLKQEFAEILLEQTLNDKKNSYAYLLQISSNIIYPNAGKPEL